MHMIAKQDSNNQNKIAGTRIRFWLAQKMIQQDALSLLMSQVDINPIFLIIIIKTNMTTLTSIGKTNWLWLQPINIRFLPIRYIIPPIRQINITKQ